MKYLFALLLCFHLVCSCKSSSNTGNKKNDNVFVKELVSKLCREEKIKSIGGSVFHVKMEQLNDEYLLSTISINSLRPKIYSYRTNYLGFEVYVYSYKRKEKKELDESPFFAPDVRDWNFLLRMHKNELLSIKQIVNYGEVDNVGSGSIKL